MLNFTPYMLTICSISICVKYVLDFFQRYLAKTAKKSKYLERIFFLNSFQSDTTSKYGVWLNYNIGNKNRGLLDRSTARYFYKRLKPSLHKPTGNLLGNLFCRKCAFKNNSLLLEKSFCLNKYNTEKWHFT